MCILVSGGMPRTDWWCFRDGKGWREKRADGLRGRKGRERESYHALRSHLVGFVFLHRMCRCWGKRTRRCIHSIHEMNQKRAKERERERERERESNERKKQ